MNLGHSDLYFLKHFDPLSFKVAFQSESMPKCTLNITLHIIIMISTCINLWTKFGKMKDIAKRNHRVSVCL